MTVQEAIRTMEYFDRNFGDYKPNHEAIQMAIEALQAWTLRNYEPILTEEERAEVLNAIIDALPSYQVDGYADNNGMFFDVFISKME